MSAADDTPQRTASSWSLEVSTAGRRVGLPLLAGIVIATAWSVAVGSLVTGALAGSVGRIDLDVVRRLASGRTPAVDAVTAAGVALTDTITVAVLWLAAVVVASRRTRGWLLPAFVMFVNSGEKLTYLLTSIIVGRPRPPVATVGHVYATHSFPSGHTASAIALYGGFVLALVWHRAGAGHPVRPPVVVALGALVAGVAVLVAFSRVYRGQHYPSDVVWGAMLGTGWLWAGWRVVLHAAGGPSGDSGVGVANVVDDRDGHADVRVG